MINVNVEKTHDNAVIPTYESELAAGFDFYAVEDVKIPVNRAIIVKTGLKFELPAGYELQVRPRSGLSLKTSLRVANSPGTVDADYRGEVGIIMQNNSDIPFKIEAGTRVAQGVIKEVPQIKLIEVDELSETKRGAGGFGSTGI